MRVKSFAQNLEIEPQNYELQGKIEDLFQMLMLAYFVTKFSGAMRTSLEIIFWLV